MVDITSPTAALLVALGNQRAAARQGRGQGVGSSVPGLPGFGTEAAPGAPAVGSAGGGIPSTATTGQSVANALLGGTGGTGDEVAQQVASVLLGRTEPGERGDLGVGVTGGSVGTLLSLLTGGPLAIPGVLASLVGSDVLGLPPDTNLLSTTGLAQLIADAESDPAQRLTRVDPTGRVIDPITFDRPFRADPLGNLTQVGRQESEIDRGRERTLSRERTTGRAVGPV